MKTRTLLFLTLLIFDMKRIVSVVLVICFLNFVCVFPLQAESLYKETTPIFQNDIFQKNTGESSFEAKLKEIHKRQETGRGIFFAGTGLMAAYVYTILFVKTQNGSLTFLFGMPLVASGIAWYGFRETVAANQEEILLKYQMQGTKEVK